MSQVTERLCEHTVTVLFRVVISLEIELGHADIGDSPVCAFAVLRRTELTVRYRAPELTVTRTTVNDKKSYNRRLCCSVSGHLLTTQDSKSIQRGSITYLGDIALYRRPRSGRHLLCNRLLILSLIGGQVIAVTTRATIDNQCYPSCVSGIVRLLLCFIFCVV